MQRVIGGVHTSNVAANRDAIPSPWAPDRWRVDPRKFSVLSPARERRNNGTTRGEAQNWDVHADANFGRTGLLQWMTYGLFVLCGMLMVAIVLLSVM